MAKPFSASYPGECAECGAEFDVGDEIMYNRDDDLIGWDCCGEEQTEQVRSWAPTKAGDNGLQQR